MCDHTNTREVKDMPIANPDTYEFEGRFDVVYCFDCSTAIERTPVENGG